MRRVLLASVLITLFSAATSFAMPKEKSGGDCTKCHTLTVKEAGDIVSKLAAGAKVTEVKQSPAPGLFEVHIESNGKSGVAHIDYSKKYVIPGLIFEIATGKPTVAPPPPPPPKKIDVSRIPLEHSVVMGNPKGTKKLIVFTDPECPFCQRLHGELSKLVGLEPDLVVYVKMYPLTIHPKAYDKARAILTASDPLAMMDKAFSGGDLPVPSGDAGKAAVDQSLQFANSIGVNSTPTIIFPDGRMELGARPAEDLRKMLDESAK